jgi:hypothetical protein
MGFLNRARELTGDPSRRLLKSGQPGWAKITHAKESGSYSGVGNDPVITFTLRVTVPDRPEYEVKHRQWVPHLLLSRAQPGGVVAVKVDPDDAKAVAIDWEGALPQEAYEPAAPAREMDFTGGPPKPAGPQLADGHEEVQAMLGAKLAFDGEHVAVVKPGSPPRVAPLAALRSIELSEGSAGDGTLGNLFVTVRAAGVTLPPLAFGPEQRAEAESFVEKIKRGREAVDPAAAKAAGGSG